ncbi:hypothetical protein LPB67_03800 [Undibacterium sp. Jales W-56]|uniref:hypothetical protein n=1 Tax=Undibacterium sp. Jales W-56 TaxID=2897325 RepID=UPI0021D0742F|nr:hypothetical protein [Undibacterium sp. Jales W-56]MCU6432901.1 hypothetical protein [Undibacterium sp. Jales W-56]
MEQKIKRRSLLGGLGLGAAVALVATKTVTTVQHHSADVNAAAEPAGDGYRLTTHIKKYYRTTTI